MLIPIEVETRFAAKMKFRVEKEWRLDQKRHSSAGKALILIGKYLIPSHENELIPGKQRSAEEKK
jgi:hypothetical protein